MKSKEYEIRSVTDLLNVPEDRFDAMLIDLKMWATMARQANIALKALGLDKQVEALGFTWIDDGKNEVLGVNIIHQGAKD